jgi:ketosteroid isomerase-like protein
MTNVTATAHDTVLALHHGFVEANRTCDVEWCRQNMHPDMVYLGTDGGDHRPRDNVLVEWEYYRDRLTRLADGTYLAMRSIDPVVTVVGDAAVVAYRADLSADVEGEKLEGTAVGTECYRLVGESWLMFHGHWSWYNADAPLSS